MIRYVAVDPGKFGTKFAEFDTKTMKVSKYCLRSKISEGDFRDDAIEKNTFVVEIDGQVFKVGNGARGDGASLDTNKRDEMHKHFILTALALLASSDEKDEMHVAIGMPAKDWSVVSKRMDYKDFMLPEGDISIAIKKKGDEDSKKKTFTINTRYVYPESIGALFMDETMADISDMSITGVIDLGNLNLNATLWQGTEPVHDKSAVAELGGAILIQELSQELSANITTCDEMIVANILKMPPEERCLPNSGVLDAEQIEESKQIIKRVLKSHAEKVMRCCRARGWSLDVTKIIAIGGTSKDIETELKEVFKNITVLSNSQYCNVLGYLRLMCSRKNELGKIIPLKTAPADADKQKG